MSKSLLAILALLLSVAAHASVSTEVLQPANGTRVGSTVQVEVQAWSGNAAINGWAIYVDGQLAYAGDGSNNDNAMALNSKLPDGSYQGTISAAVPVPSGTHQITVRAWNAAGDYASSQFSVVH